MNTFKLHICEVTFGLLIEWEIIRNYIHTLSLYSLYGA